MMMMMSEMIVMTMMMMITMITMMITMRLFVDLTPAGKTPGKLHLDADFRMSPQQLREPTYSTRKATPALCPEAQAFLALLE